MYCIAQMKILNYTCNCFLHTSPCNVSASSQVVYWQVMWYTEPELIQLRLTSWDSSRGWDRLSYPDKKSSPGGYYSLPVWTTEKWRSLTSALRPASAACTIQPCRHADAHIYQHTILFCRHRGLEGYAAQFLSLFSLSASSSIMAGAACTSPTSHYPLAVSPILSSFQPLAAISAPQCFPLFLSLALFLFIHACQVLNI